MALEVFEKRRCNNHPPTQWIVNVNRKFGNFYLNNKIADDLKLEYGQKGILAYDDETKEWLVAFGNDLKGFSLHRLNNKDYKQRYCFSGTKAAHRILNDVNAEIAASFLISQKPRIIDGVKWYRILSKTPIRKN